MLVDTPVWSLALRRRHGDLSAADRSVFEEWAKLVRAGQAELIGPIRQELLSGLKRETDVVRVKKGLGAFLDLVLVQADYEEAAHCANRCLARGIAISSVDALICAVALRRAIAIFTMDQDFKRYSSILPIALHRAH